MNKLQLLGRLGKDAELRYTPAGKEVLTFSLATDDGFGESKRTIWFNVSMFGERTVKLQEYLKKGTPVCVSGGLTMREFESQGEKRTSLDMRVDGLKLMGIAKSGDDAQRGAPTRSTRETSDDELPF